MQAVKKISPGSAEHGNSRLPLFSKTVNRGWCMHYLGPWLLPLPVVKNCPCPHLKQVHRDYEKKAQRHNLLFL
ncbi:unnamed protein product [Allacma fusca]|uniref:Uncharacterized protein n=1 Tax=Allacma fusca TaxID=39272 RepID=A0A8J2P937_9HEXA|nr:unnamed protein product [Allacma fusca]